MFIDVTHIGANKEELAIFLFQVETYVILTDHETR